MLRGGLLKGHEGLVQSLSFERTLLASGELLIRSAIAKSDENPGLNIDLAVNLIGQGRFDEVIYICNKHLEEEASNQPIDQAILFNLAIATWGKTLQVPVDIFQSVLDLGMTELKHSANYLQCMSLANWAVGRLAEAEELLAESRRKATTVEFSCWSYLFRTPPALLQELDQQKEMFSGKEVLPEVISSKSGE